MKVVQSIWDMVRFRLLFYPLANKAVWTVCFKSEDLHMTVYQLENNMILEGTRCVEL